MTNNEEDTGWDNLADEFGLEPGEKAAPAAKAEPPAPAPKPAARPAPKPRRPEPKPEPEDDAADFGAGFEVSGAEALFDPGPDVVADEGEDLDDAEDEGDDGEVGDETEPGAEGTDGGKKKRRRRRRRKKKGPDAPADGGEAEAGGEPVAEVAAEDDEVEEGEAPGEFDGDGENEPAPSAVDEEMDEEAAGPTPKWQVMSWNELVSKLHRPN